MLSRDKLDLDNRDLDRVVALFRILADQGDLDTVLDYLHPENAERHRTEWPTEHRCLPGYVQALCRDEYGPPEWQGLNLRLPHRQLCDLH